MAHESFEDEATARVMNELFVNIKVDREERPDIDQIYMNALHLLGEQGGWPLTMFLTPAGEPVWGGTYFPKSARYGRAAFVDVLREIARLFREEPERIAQEPRRADGAACREGAAGRQGRGRRARARSRRERHRARDRPDPWRPARCAEISAMRDLRTALARRRARRARKTRRAPPRRFFGRVLLTLEHICEGGIYDHLGGGFARYSVDARWLVPHFEKMLYDNAQLLELLAVAHAATGAPLYLERARRNRRLARARDDHAGGRVLGLARCRFGGRGGQILCLVARRGDAGAGGRGRSFFAAQYDVTAGGNFEGHNILNRLKDLPRSTARTDTATEDSARLAMLRGKLLQVRENRVRPGLDDKVLADWNGLMIAALANGGALLGEPAGSPWRGAPSRFIAAEMTRGDRLGHSWRAGRLLFPGLASDFAGMIKAALALHEATGERSYLEHALAWQRALDRHYANPDNGGYFLTADDAEGLVVRPAATHDDAIPNPNAFAAAKPGPARACSPATTPGATRPTGCSTACSAPPGENLIGHAALLNALDLRLRGAEIVVTGTGARADALARRRAANCRFLDRIVLRAPTAEALPAAHPARDKIAAAPRRRRVRLRRRALLAAGDEPTGLFEAVSAMRSRSDYLRSRRADFCQPCGY